MIVETVGLDWPFSGEQIYDLAADIERYPEFLRGWIEARIIRRDAGGCEVEQVLGIGPMRHQFRSRAILQRPHRLVVESHCAPFRRFSLEWRIEGRGVDGCRVAILAEVQMRSPVLQRLVDRTLPSAVEEILSAFRERASVVYHGGRGQPA